MRTRQLGNSDLHLTRVGLGAWAIGGGDWAYGWGPQDDRQSIDGIHRALDLGINWIDTAAVYGLGHSEEVVARALAGRRDKVMVATKCGLPWREGSRAVRPSLAAESIRREAENSLRRLKLDVIDLYQIHWPSPARQIEEAWATIARLVQEGKVRHAGVSNFSVEQMRTAQAIYPIASLQPPYSMIDRAVEEEILPFCAKNGIGVVAYSPMQSGLLTGAFDHERLDRLAPGDWRRKDSAFREPVFSRALELVDRLKLVAARADRTVAQLAITWVLRRPEVTAAIVGVRRPQQVEETAAAADSELSGAELEEVDRILLEVAVPQPMPLR